MTDKALKPLSYEDEMFTENSQLLSVYYHKLSSKTIVPTKAYCDDMGWDIYTPRNYVIYPQRKQIINIELAIELPQNYGALIKDRSSLAQKDLHIIGGVIDAGYRGEISVVMFNFNQVSSYHLYEGDKIGQLIILPVPNIQWIEKENLSISDRNTKSFGSSGK